MKRDKLFNNKDSEADFCESYKSQILGNSETEEGESFFSTIVKLLTILILLVIIISVSFYGYNYFMNSQTTNSIVLPPISMQVSDDNLIVEMEEELVTEDLIKSITVKEEKNISIPLIVTEQVKESDIEKIANDVKIAIAKSELKEENETKIEEVSKNVEPKNIESMAAIEELIDTEEIESLEVPTSAPEAKYLEELADLSKEIDKERNP